MGPGHTRKSWARRMFTMSYHIARTLALPFAQAVARVPEEFKAMV